MTIVQNKSEIKIHQVQKKDYEALRKMAFAITPDQLGISLPTDKTLVYGIVMDWEINGGIATTIAYQTGDASLYISSGGGIIGGGKHQHVNLKAKQFVASAQTYLDKASKVDSPILPGKDTVIFYLLTNKGFFFGQEEIKNFENDSSAWLPLFEQGNDVLTEMRSIGEK